MDLSLTIISGGDEHKQTYHITYLIASAILTCDMIYHAPQSTAVLAGFGGTC